MPVNRDPDLEAIYEIHRKYLQHEDELVHQRTMSFITIQSFILATFGLTYQKKYEVAEKMFASGKPLTALGSMTSEYNGFLLVLALVGIATSFIAWRSIRAAVRAIYSIEHNWLKIINTRKADYFPGMTGGGDGVASRDGIALATWAPLFLLALWLTTLFVLVFVFDIRVSLK